jgi:two-component system LytT family sensor kinase
MEVLLGFVLGIGSAAIAMVAWRELRRPRAATPESAGMQTALHAATATLPHLRLGLTPRTASRVAPYLRALTGAAAIAIADTETVLAIDGAGRSQVRPGDLLSRLLERATDERIHVEPHLVSSDPSCPLRSAAIAPLIVSGKRAGALIAFYSHPGRPRHHELRVIQEAAALVAAQVTLSVLDEHEERLAQAELRALRAQMSPHFTYNALAAVAGDIHQRPEEARELLTDFAEFTRYLFRDGRSYVSLAEELEHVARYVRLEQARFRDRLTVAVEVDQDALPAVVPALSVQPLVENAIRHGAERCGGSVRIAVSGVVRGADVVVSVEDDGPGIEPRDLANALAGNGNGNGIGLSNVDARLRATFGERYALEVRSAPGAGTTAVMRVPAIAGSGAAPPAALVAVIA